MLDEVLQPLVGELALVCPARVVEAAEEAAEGIGVSALDTHHGVNDCFADVRAGIADVLPMTAFRHLEAVILGQCGEVLVAIRKLQCLGGFLVVDVGDPLEEEQRRDVALVLVLVDGASQDVAGPEQVVS